VVETPDPPEPEPLEPPEPLELPAPPEPLPEPPELELPPASLVVVSEPPVGFAPLQATESSADTAQKQVGFSQFVIGWLASLVT
ncbi:MAG: hypothetical protein M3O46_13495, partial [Myxococcota bacterium]|nr:hypothetical protein [Myxococcota bacterium]